MYLDIPELGSYVIGAVPKLNGQDLVHSQIRSLLPSLT